MINGYQFMSQNWNDPFSPQRLGRRIGVAMLIGGVVTLGVVGPSMLRYQRLNSQIQHGDLKPIAALPFEHQLQSVLGRTGSVSVTSNGWIISGSDPESWVVQMGSMAMDIPIQHIRVGISQGGYQLILQKESL
jgi:hypothetical protein